jgi:hypothetical protein
MVEGFGLRWKTTNPPEDATTKHAQKLLQVDRELGLLDFIQQQRNTFYVEDNIKAITVDKQLSNKPAPVQGGFRGVLGLAFGIISSFTADITAEVMEPSRK